MTATTTPVALLPPSMEIFVDSSSTSSPLPECVANLMPFNIDYDGPAPIDSFLVLRKAPSLDNEKEGTSQSYISAFRGRAIQSTPLPLPAGYKAKLITVSQVAPEASTPSASRSGNEAVAAIADKIEAKEREAKRQRLAKPPQRQQRFSMDSDDDEGNEEEHGFSQEASPEPYQSTAPLSPEVEATEVSGVEGKQVKEEALKIKISPLAEVSGDELRIWGADGPIDKGDDTFVRTIAEWYSVVSPLFLSRSVLNTLLVKESFTSIKHLPGQGNGRSASRALKRYRADRTALERITKNSIRRLARRGGCKRIAGTVYEETRFILRDFLARTVKDAICYSMHCNRKTIMTMDIILALKLQGRTLYHF